MWILSLTLYLQSPISAQNITKLYRSTIMKTVPTLYLMKSVVGSRALMEMEKYWRKSLIANKFGLLFVVVSFPWHILQEIKFRIQPLLQKILC